MYSPFLDEQGRPKTLEEVAFEDLSQLADLEEGFVLEFKRSWNESVKKKVPKIIASFANSRGGWLVIGIADDDRSVCPIPRQQADFSQIIGELCRRHVFPTPRFDARFVADPADRERGAVVVQVHEGDFPPYVADGVVEVREGSTSGPAAGSALVELYDKATKRAGEVEAFCRRTVWFPRDELGRLSPAAARDDAAGAGPLENQPLFSLYLFRMGARTAEVPSRAALETHARAMRRAFSQQNMECHVQHAHDSLIFRASITTPYDEAHSAIELFADESAKITVPAVMLDPDERAQAVRWLASAGIAALDRVRLIEARGTLQRVTCMASLLDRYVRERGIPWKQYAVAYELEGMAGVMLWSPDEAYRAYVRDHGSLFCGTTDGRSRVRYLDDGAHDSFRARQFAGSHFFEACGLPLGSPDPDDNALVDALLRGGRPYPGDRDS